MRYAVLTAKHHDGFCLFGSALSACTSVHATGRDLVREFVDAMRAEGPRVGLYYSLLDWHHPDFTVDGHHPLRDTEARREPRDIARARSRSAPRTPRPRGRTVVARRRERRGPVERTQRFGAAPLKKRGAAPSISNR